MVSLMESFWDTHLTAIDDHGVRLPLPANIPSLIDFSGALEALNNSLYSMVGNMKDELVQSLGDRIEALTKSTGVVDTFNSRVEAQKSIVTDYESLADNRLTEVNNHKAVIDYAEQFKIDTPAANGKDLDSSIDGQRALIESHNLQYYGLDSLVQGGGWASSSSFNGEWKTADSNRVAAIASVAGITRDGVLTAHANFLKTSSSAYAESSNTEVIDFAGQTTSASSENGGADSDIANLKLAIEQSETYLKQMQEVKAKMESLFVTV